MRLGRRQREPQDRQPDPDEPEVEPEPEPATAEIDPVDPDPELADPVDPDLEPAGPVVAGSDLHKRYGEGERAVDALRGVTVAFERETFSAIMGPSGSGKSTLMHVLAGLDTATEGAVEIAGTPLNELKERDRARLRREHVGFVFQTFNLMPTLTAQENILLPVRLAGESVDKDWLEELLETLDLADRRKHRPSQLSGGQQQRVAIARALITKPSVIFADEPTGNLDSQAGDAVLDALTVSAHELGHTVVMVTHDPRAAACAERVVFLADGCLVREEPGMSAADIARVVRRG